jgi:hypothetical protein
MISRSTVRPEAVDPTATNLPQIMMLLRAFPLFVFILTTAEDRIRKVKQMFCSSTGEETAKRDRDHLARLCPSLSSRLP